VISTIGGMYAYPVATMRPSGGSPFNAMNSMRTACWRRPDVIRCRACR
jgi:hypothetical protein